jgi:hypothetical protein
VLLLATKDIALMNQHRMLEAAREDVEGAMPAGIDQIWYVEPDGCVVIDLTSALVNGQDEVTESPRRAGGNSSRIRMCIGSSIVSGMNWCAAESGGAAGLRVTWHLGMAPLVSL